MSASASPVRVALYARYSSDQQREASIEDQLRLCTARAGREGWVVTASYSDAAISGATLARPGYQALLAAMRAGEVDIVLAESLDRFSRDLEHIAAFHKQALFCGVRIVTLAESDVSEMTIGFKGTMGALYLRDLAAKTLRGLEGRIRHGRAVGAPPYGYRVVRRLGADGEPERGLREIDPAQATIVRRIFRDYAGGMSPRAIARALNAEGIPGPRTGIWYDQTLRGRPGRADGLLRNPLYAGRLVWNRFAAATDPQTGTRVWRQKEQQQVVEADVPHLRIVDDGLWQRVQARLAAEAAPRPALGSHGFWNRRRPRHLLSGKVICGGCGRKFAAIGKGYLGCAAARSAGGCRNTATVHRARLEARVLDALGSRLMQPDLVEAFCTAFIEEWNRRAAEANVQAAAYARELEAVERRLANLVDAIADGLRAPGLQQKLDALEARRAALGTLLEAAPPAPPALPPDLARVYAERVAALRRALDANDGPEVVEAARALIDTVIVSPPSPGSPDKAPRIELTGNLIEMLRAGGANLTPDTPMPPAAPNTTPEGSVKEGMGAKPSRGPGQRPGSEGHPRPLPHTSPPFT